MGKKNIDLDGMEDVEMVTISNGVKQAEVSVKAFENVYAGQGWTERPLEKSGAKKSAENETGAPLSDGKTAK